MPFFRSWKPFWLFLIAFVFLFSFPHTNAQFIWAPQAGDELVVNVATNEGYLVRPTTGELFPFPVITGQRRTLYYLGLRYFGGTPAGTWEALSKETQGDRITYGASGRFIRLYKDGTRTHYGIHGHRDETVMFAQDDRYQSMGCIIVPDAILSLVEETFDVNGGAFRVTTIG